MHAFSELLSLGVLKKCTHETTSLVHRPLPRLFVAPSLGVLSPVNARYASYFDAFCLNMKSGTTDFSQYMASITGANMDTFYSLHHCLMLAIEQRFYSHVRCIMALKSIYFFLVQRILGCNIFPLPFSLPFLPYRLKI